MNNLMGNTQPLDHVRQPKSVPYTAPTKSGQVTQRANPRQNFATSASQTAIVKRPMTAFLKATIRT